MRSTVKLLFGTAAAAVLLMAGSVPAAVTSDPLQLPTIYLSDTDGDPYTRYGSGHVEGIGLGEESAEAFPQLAQAINDFNDDYVSGLKGRFDEFCEASRLDRTENGMEYEASLEADMYPVRWDEQVFSLMTFYSSYSGGAHGYYAYTGHNFETSTGRELTAGDLFTDIDALKDVLWEKLCERYPDLVENDLLLTLDTYGTGPDDVPFNFVTEAEGVTFIFNPYEIASYAAGALFAHIRFDEHPELFTGAAETQKGSYTRMVHPDVPLFIDPDGDGIADEVKITRDYDLNMDISGITVSIGDEQASDGTYSFALRPLIIHTEDGRTYLYMEEKTYSDWYEIDIFDLSAKTPVFAAEIGAGFNRIWDEEVRTRTLLMPTDPSVFELAGNLTVLGTFTGIRRYSTDAGSVCEPLDELYRVETSQPLKLEMDMPALALDPKTGAELDMVTVSAGEELIIRRTDGEEIVDMERNDGSMVRVYLGTDEASHKRTINGISVNEYFWRIYYAG